MALGSACLVLFPGCVTQPKETYTSKHDVGAVWNHPRLRATLPGIEPARVIAAADLTLRDRGYFITINQSNADRGRVSARPNNSNMGSSVTVWAEADDQGGTVVSVSAGPFGDELLSRIVLDGIVDRLGLAE